MSDLVERLRIYYRTKRYEPAEMIVLEAAARIEELEGVLVTVEAVVARRSVPTMDATWTAAYNSALDAVAAALKGPSVSQERDDAAT